MTRKPYPLPLVTSAQYPRVLSAYDAGGGVWFAALYRVAPWAEWLLVAECRHPHRVRRKALECAERLAREDGAPSV